VEKAKAILAAEDVRIQKAEERASKETLIFNAELNMGEVEPTCQAAGLEKEMKEMKETMQLILKVLNGNGHIGIVTRVALLRSSLFLSWLALGSVLAGILGIAYYIIQCGVTGT